MHPVTGVTGMHVAVYARQLASADLSPSSAARKLAAVAGWYAWLERRGHIGASPAVGIARPRRPLAQPATPGLTPDQALSLVRAADTAPGAQRARTAALVAVLLFTGARVSEIIGADIADLGTERGRRVLRVTRGDGQRRSLTLPAPAAARIDAYLAERDGPGSPARRRRDSAEPRALFATASGQRLFAADVWRIVRRLAARAACRTNWPATSGPRRCATRSRRCTWTPAARWTTCSRSWATPTAHHPPLRPGRHASRSPGDVVAAYLAARAHDHGQRPFS